MSALQQHYPTVSPKEYFHYRDYREGKFELHDGMIVAMAGGTLSHNRLEISLSTLINLSIDRENCEVFGSNQSVAVEEYENYYYPDVTVVCGELKCDEKTNITNPILIVEVLSNSTALYDRNTKFERYKAIPTLQYYVLVSQDTPRIEIFVRDAESSEGWSWANIEGLDSHFHLPIFTQPLTLADIYAKVTFE